MSPQPPTRVAKWRRIFPNAPLIPFWWGRKKPIRAGYLDEANVRQWMREPDYLRRMDEESGISLLLVKPYAAIDLDRDEDLAEFARLNPWAATTLTTRGGRGEKYFIRVKGEYPQRVLHVYANGEHLGEFRGATTAILDNLHPSGKPYEARNEGCIAEVAYDQIIWPAGGRVEVPRCREFEPGFNDAVEGGLLDLSLLKHVHPHPTNMEPCKLSVRRAPSPAATDQATI